MGAFGRFRELLDLEEGFEDLRMEEESRSIDTISVVMFDFQLESALSFA
ncbi:uncharacterized protein G2W53_021568 [Senna tora]|uniref:Uncharacterized protein n=1 Tax=Senna tora TaxID=362788 RepID=A0A834TT24_9FABA|nr:uncharacterized protein G2W53_021568 [Senna tora]